MTADTGRADRDRRARIQRRWIAEAATVVVVLVATVVLVFLVRRPGHWWGDDWALYVRQAESIFSGGTGRVVADNEFTVEVSGLPAFSPPMYPWGFPLLLSPFVAVLGTDLDRLVIAQAVFFCWFLLMWYRLARPRVGPALAVGGMVVLAFSPQLLRWTELIQSEIAFLAVALSALVVLDLRSTRRALVTAGAPLWPLVAVGVVAAFAFTVRREGLAAIAAIGVAQLTTLAVWWRADRPAPGTDPEDDSRLGCSSSHERDELQPRWPERSERPEWAARLVGRLAMPYLAAGALILFVQVVLPSTLVPRYSGNGLHNVPKFASDHLGHVMETLGLKFVATDTPTVLGSSLLGSIAVVVFLAAMVAGIVVAVWRRPHLDLPIAVFMVGALAIGGSFRLPGSRYVAAVGPIALVFALVGLRELARRVPQRRVGGAVAVTLVALLVVGNVVRAGTLVGNSREFERAGRTEWGPDHPDSVDMFDAVDRLTDDDDVIGFFKARAMTQRTDRRAIQIDEVHPVDRYLDTVTHVVIESTLEARAEFDTATADLTPVEIWMNPRFTLLRLVPN